jgi:hypothetical protein
MERIRLDRLPYNIKTRSIIMKRVSLETIKAAKSKQKTPWTKEEMKYLQELYCVHGLMAATIHRLGVFPGRSFPAISEQVRRLRK